MKITKGDHWRGWQSLASSVIRPHSMHRGCDWSRYHGVVIESDDWGMCGEGKDNATHERLSSLGHRLDSKPGGWSYANTLETTEDLQGLYQTLEGFVDGLGRNPVLTANFIMTNPWYSRIAERKFSGYYFVPITKGFPGTWASRNRVLDSWRSGVKRKIMVPEYHGFSHFNHSKWIDGLRQGDRKLLDYFKEEMFTTSGKHATISEYGTVGPGGVNFESLRNQYQKVAIGREIFRRLFGRYPRSTIPPHDIANPQTLIVFASAGINLVQSDRTTLTGILGIRPLRPDSALRALARVIAQLALVFRSYRNVFLEPMETQPGMKATSALELSIELLRSGRPVIVGSHRQNYVGGVEPKNSERGRRRLASYLAGLKEDSKIVFLSSYEASQLSFSGRSVESFGDEFIIRNYTRGDLKIIVAGPKRYTLRDLAKEQPGSVSVENVEAGAKVFVPAGRTLTLGPEI